MKSSIVNMESSDMVDSVELTFDGALVTFYILVKKSSISSIKLSSCDGVIDYTDLKTKESVPFDISIDDIDSKNGQPFTGWFVPADDMAYMLDLSSTSGNNIQVAYGSTTRHYNGKSYGGGIIVYAEDGTVSEFNDLMIQFNWFEYDAPSS